MKPKDLRQYNLIARRGDQITDVVILVELMLKRDAKRFVFGRWEGLEISVK